MASDREALAIAQHYYACRIALTRFLTTYAHSVSDITEACVYSLTQRCLASRSHDSA